MSLLRPPPGKRLASACLFARISQKSHVQSLPLRYLQPRPGRPLTIQYFIYFRFSEQCRVFTLRDYADIYNYSKSSCVFATGRHGVRFCCGIYNGSKLLTGAKSCYPRLPCLNCYTSTMTFCRMNRACLFTTDLLRGD